MNERIKTLALTIPNVYSIEYENGTKGIEFTEEAFERFAGLIVRECADVTHSLIVEDGEEFPMKSVAYRLKRHFGANNE